MKIPGLGGTQSAQLKTGESYLLRATGAALRDTNGNSKARLEVNFTVEQGEAAGSAFVEDFYLTQKAMSRVRMFLSRAGYPEDLLTQDELDPAKVIGLLVWSPVKEEEYQGQKVWRTDGWNFRAVEEGAAEQEPVIDHTKEAQSPAEDF